MRSLILYALIAGICTWLITALGAAMVIFFKNPNGKIMDIMLGFAAGVMIAASFWSLLAPAISKCEENGIEAVYVAVPSFFAGALFMWLSDRSVLFIQNKLQRKNDIFSSGITMLVFSITLHNIPEGLAVGIAFGALGDKFTSEALIGAIIIALGIGLQNFPEGAAVSLPLRREGNSRIKSFMIGQASALVEPVFAVIGAAAVMKIERIMPYALSFAAGAMILVAVHEIIPECQSHREKTPYLASFGIIIGFGVMMFLDVLLS